MSHALIVAAVVLGLAVPFAGLLDFRRTVARYDATGSYLSAPARPNASSDAVPVEAFTAHVERR